MRLIIPTGVLALGLAATPSFGAGDVGLGTALAQSGAATQPVQDAPEAVEVKQIALTPAKIEQFVSAKKDMDAVLEKMPDGTDVPDTGTMAKLDVVARKFKFADYREYDAVENNIGIVLAGVDPAAKRYIGAEAVIRKQVAEIQADKQISAKDKKDTIDQLNATLPTVPKLQFPENVDVVLKDYDRISEAMPQD